MTTLAGLVLGVLGWYEMALAPIVYSAEVEEPKEVIIEIKESEWTKEKVQEEIRKVFPDAPIMLEVARCESGYIPHAHNTTLNKDGSTDGGVFQLNDVHNEALNKLSLDKFNPKDNIAFARMLYEKNGLRDWKGSRHCWEKAL